MLSAAESWCPQFGQRERGETIDSFNGTRWTTTPMKLPKTSPPTAASAIANQSIVAEPTFAGDARRGSGRLAVFQGCSYLLPTVVAIGLFATPYVPLMPSIAAHFFDGQSSTVEPFGIREATYRRRVSLTTLKSHGFSRQLCAQ